jgi:hypothetical protein
MKAYLSKMQDLEGKPVYCFLTQHFRFRFLGGDNALKQFELALNDKSARFWAPISSIGKQETRAINRRNRRFS